MKKLFRIPFFGSQSDNLKSKIRNRKLVGIVAIVVALTMCGARVEAQQPGKIFRIGFLDGGSASGSAVFVKAFLQELTKHGWIEGKNLAIEYRFAENKGPERLRELAADLVRLKVDLIVSTSTQEARAAKRATNSIPIVMTSVGDPVGSGLVASLARPGGNITGFGSFTPELITKRLEILKDVVPKLAQVGVLYPPETGAGPQLKELRAAVATLKLKLVEIPTQANAKELENAFQTAKQKRVDGILTQANPRFFTERKRIVELAGKHRLPTIHFQEEFVDEGGLVSYGADFPDLYRRAAVYVDKILKGAKPADLPVQQATKFEFIINLKAAKQIGLTIPQKVLTRADRVIR